MGTIKVLVVDDSPLAREVLREILCRDEDIEVVGEATNGREAVQLSRSLSPHLITMDLNMPVMDGFSAIEEIMHTKGVPILVVSDRTNAEAAYRALEVGALEVMPKPTLDEQDTLRLLARVRVLAGVAVITRLRRRPLQSCAIQTRSDTALISNTPTMTQPHPIVAIACSTGGPQALARILSQVPANFSAPIVIAQHISHGFIDGMALWLGSLCRLPVSVAKSGEHLKPGCVYLSPSESNLQVTEHHRLRLQPSPPHSIYHPCCDSLLISVAQAYGADAIGVILTGMGRDGVQGMRAIYQAGGTTFAQDEASSVIYGMNQEAVNAGVIKHVVPLDELTEQLLNTVYDRAPFAWPEST